MRSVIKCHLNLTFEFYRLEHYWTYELCHGRYIRQYHEERDGKNVKVFHMIDFKQTSNNPLLSLQTTEYYLGEYSSERFDDELAALKSEEAAGTAPRPHKMKIENLNMPYYELVMDGGTLCDLNGKARVTRVNYVCYPAGEIVIDNFSCIR